MTPPNPIGPTDEDDVPECKNCHRRHYGSNNFACPYPCKNEEETAVRAEKGVELPPSKHVFDGSRSTDDHYRSDYWQSKCHERQVQLLDALTALDEAQGEIEKLGYELAESVRGQKDLSAIRTRLEAQLTSLRELKKQP